VLELRRLEMRVTGSECWSFVWLWETPKAETWTPKAETWTP